MCLEKFSVFIKDEVAITSNSMDLKVVLTALASCIADIAKVIHQGAIGGTFGKHGHAKYTRRSSKKT